MNIAKATKTELLTLAKLKCRHGHSYLSHPQCLVTEKPALDPTRRHLGFFDIESSHLKANFGFVLGYRIWDDDNQVMLGRNVTPKEINPQFKFDEELLKEMVEDLKKFTHVVVYWGKDRRHDMPFCRTRCLMAGVRFPEYGELGVIDMYDLAKNKMSLHSYRLGVVCEELGVEAKGHPLKGKMWIMANAGHGPSLDYIGVHNEEDVKCMPPVLYALEPYYRKSKLSI